MKRMGGLDLSLFPGMGFHVFTLLDQLDILGFIITREELQSKDCLSKKNTHQQVLTFQPIFKHKTEATGEI